MKVGDTVRLKSGGPALTITELPLKHAHKPKYWCVWFTVEGHLRHGDFPPNTLQPVLQLAI